MSKRMPVEIIADILDECLRQSPKTRIMYRSNLSFAGVTKYLAWLTSAGLLEKDSSSKKYSTTTKGEEFISCWLETRKLFQTEKQNLQIRVYPQSNFSSRWSNDAIDH